LTLIGSSCAEVEQRLQWEMLLLEEEKDVCDTLQQRQAIQVWHVKH
jgi:hypothetical protein